MTNLTHDEIIAYGLSHEDETVRELAQRFKDYRDVVLRLRKTDYEPVRSSDVPMFLKKQAY